MAKASPSSLLARLCSQQEGWSFNFLSNWTPHMQQSGCLSSCLNLPDLQALSLMDARNKFQTRSSKPPIYYRGSSIKTNILLLRRQAKYFLNPQMPNGHFDCSYFRKKQTKKNKKRSRLIRQLGNAGGQRLAARQNPGVSHSGAVTHSHLLLLPSGRTTAARPSSDETPGKNPLNGTQPNPFV